MRETCQIRPDTGVIKIKGLLMGIRSTRKNQTLLAISAGALGIIPVTAAHSQERGNRAALDEIVVTARKSEERLQDVPISISAFSDVELKAAGIQNVVDVASATPGFSFLQAFGRSGSGDGSGGPSRPAVRGMSSILGAANASFFVDGIYFSSNITSLQLDNLERVEVIRGPQSALFGRQTFAGAINFITRKPDDEVRGQVNATAGQYGRYELSGFVSGPLIENRLFGEINARYYDFGGDYTNANTGKRDINAQNTRNIGGKLRFTPTENLEMILNVAYSRDQDLGYASTRYLQESLNCLLPPIVGGFPFPGGIPIAGTRSRGWLCGKMETPDQVAYDNEGLRELGYYGVERENVRSDFTIEYEFANSWLLTSQTAYNRSWNINGYDNDLGIRGVRNLTIGRTGREDISQELRMLSPRDRRFRSLFGVYYYDLDDRPGWDVVTSGASAGQRNRFDTGAGVENSAVFAMFEYDFTDRLTATAEGRYQRDKIVATSDSNGGTPEVTPFTNRRTETFDKFLPRLTARFALSDELNLYASFAKGNKPGGFNNFPTDIEQSYVDEWLERGFDIIGEENVDSLELGLKGTFADNRYSFNIAVFDLDWKSQQLTRAEPYQLASNGTFSTQPLLVNAGRSNNRGFEVELTGRPVEWFDVRATYSFTSPKFKNYYDDELEALRDTDGETSFLAPDFEELNPADVDGPNGQARGQVIPQTSQHQATLAFTFRRNLSAAWSGFIRNDFNYEGKRYVQTDNLLYADDNLKWNLRLGADSDNLSVSVYVNNVLDDDTPIVGTRLFDFERPILVPNPVRSFAGIQGLQFTFYRGFLASLPRKREVGLTLNYRF